MHYTVRARLIPGTAAEFLRKLTDGTVAKQEPYGREVVASMKRAVIDEEGVVRWSEVCYCPTPLEQERANVYDQHFTAIETQEAEEYVQFEGEAFMEYLASPVG
ncbi:MAG: hypothetical protein IH945_11775 [Armatimonadetes bacterium]|nr:hypothetical protein [Armatimonadota bacterium]